MIWFIVGLIVGGIVGFCVSALVAFGSKQDSL